jgi:hypothetical protein
MSSDNGNEILHVERLAEDLDLGGVHLRPGDEDHANIAEPRVAPQRVDELETAHAGHQVIDEHDARAGAGAKLAKNIAEARKLARVIALVAQDLGDARSDVRIVFCDEDVRRTHAGPLAFTLRRRRTNRKDRAPFDGAAPFTKSAPRRRRCPPRNPGR